MKFSKLNAQDIYKDALCFVLFDISGKYCHLTINSHKCLILLDNSGTNLTDKLMFKVVMEAIKLLIKRMIIPSYRNQTIIFQFKSNDLFL